jgi:hypothetical protein
LSKQHLHARQGKLKHRVIRQMLKSLGQFRSRLVGAALFDQPLRDLQMSRRHLGGAVGHDFRRCELLPERRFVHFSRGEIEVNGQIRRERFRHACQVRRLGAVARDDERGRPDMNVHLARRGEFRVGDGDPTDGKLARKCRRSISRNRAAQHDDGLHGLWIRHDSLDLPQRVSALRLIESQECNDTGAIRRRYFDGRAGNIVAGPIHGLRFVRPE